MPFYVYILHSSSLKKFYVGSTISVDERLVRHNSGRVNFTKKGVPWKLICHFEVETRPEAFGLELKIKKRGIERYLKESDFWRDHS